MSSNEFNPTTFNTHTNFYRSVMLWLAASFGIAGIAGVVIGPIIPKGMMIVLSLGLIGLMIATAFTKALTRPGFSKAYAIVIPTIFGIISYPLLNSYLNIEGGAMIIVQALIGTAMICVGAAVLGWKSDKNLYRWESKMFIILISVIVMSLLNVFLFKLAIIATLISAVTLVLFSIWMFIDIQKVRDRAYGEAFGPEFYATQLFVDIMNIFTSLLRLIR